MKKNLLLAIILLLWACQPTSGRPLAELLRSDGTFDLSASYNGNVDVSGYRLVADDNGTPRFVADNPVASVTSPIRPEVLDASADDDIYWENLFGGYYERAEINVISLVDGNLYVGGKFNRIGGIEANNIAKWDGDNWQALGSGIEDDPYQNATVRAIAVMGDDLFAGGNFSHAGGVPVNHIAKWDGENWSDLDEGLNGQVQALTVIENDLYVGGDFTIGGITRVNGIARWDGDSWRSLGPGFSHGIYDVSVKALAAIGTTLYAAGWFSSSGDNAVNNIASWDGQVWSPLGTGIQGARFDQVYALAVKGDNVYAGGKFKFTTSNGEDANNIAKWDGENWSALGGSMVYGWVYALAFIGEDLFVGGSFNFRTPQWTWMSNIAKWDGSRWSLLGSGMNSPVHTLAASDDGLLYAGGKFVNAGGIPADKLAKWDGNKWYAVLEIGPVIEGWLNALAIMGGELYAGGRFIYAGGVECNNIAKWDGQRWTALGTGTTGTVEALAVMGNHLYVGGFFYNAGGVEVKSIAKWDGQNWSSPGSGIEVDGNAFAFVYALAVMGDVLYAAGDFTIAGGKEAKYVAQWNGEEWSALGSGFERGYRTEVRALAVMKDKLFAGGNFTNAGTTQVNRVAEWNGTQWLALGSGVEDGSVFSLAVLGETLYAGGRFTTAGGTTVNHIAKWRGTKWSALGSGIHGDPNTSVNALAVMGSELYVGGRFITAGGIEANGTARWVGQSWSSLGSGQNDVNTFVVMGNKLYAGVSRWSKPVSAAAVTRNLTTPQSEPLSFNEPDDVTGISIRITTASGGPVIHAFRYEDSPVAPGGISGNVSRYRWIIQQAGLAYPFEAEVRFRVSDIPRFGETRPEDVIVFSRSVPVTGYFLPLDTSYDSETGEIVARDVADFGEFAFGNVATRTEDPTDGPDVPGEYLLEQNYPNPFNPATTIEFSLPQPGMVTLTVYNILGQKVAILVSGELPAGSHTFHWDATAHAGGVYVYRLTANGFTGSRKMLLMK